MGKVYDIEKEKISEQSKKRIFILLQINIYSEQKRKNENLKEHLHLTSAHCIIYLESDRN